MISDSVSLTIRRFNLLSPGGRVVVALSGGGDSVALLYLLRELAERGDLVVAGAAHFNHQLRAAADDDEQFCRELCAGLHVPLHIGRDDVRAVATELKRSVEDTARHLRYAFLNEVADRLNADAIAVGHSRDDQAETFLLRIIRGAGTRGLSAIRPKAGRVIRPLIETSRAELRRFAAERGLVYREDESNADLAIPRNRVRHELLPYLAREFSPAIADVLAREAELAREDNERLESEAIEIARSVVLTVTYESSADLISSSAIGSSADPQHLLDAGRVVELVVDALNALHPAIGSRVARIALTAFGGGRFIGFEQVGRFLDFARAGKEGSAISLPGQQAVHLGDRIRLQPEPPRLKSSAIRARAADGERPVSTPRWGISGSTSPKPRRGEGGHSFEFPLSIPGEVVLAASRLAVSADWAAAPDAAASTGVSVLVQGLNGPLAVRSRRSGDRFHPPGMDGRGKKLQDYFVDRKVPRGDRDRVPLVVDGDDRIVWIVGHAVAEGFRAAAPSPGVILLKARQLGGEV